MRFIESFLPFWFCQKIAARNDHKCALRFRFLLYLTDLIMHIGFTVSSTVPTAINGNLFRAAVRMTNPLPTPLCGRFVRTDTFSGSLRSSEEGQVFWTPLKSFLELPLADGMPMTFQVFLNENFSEHFFSEEGTGKDEWNEVLK